MFLYFKWNAVFRVDRSGVFGYLAGLLRYSNISINNIFCYIYNKGGIIMLFNLYEIPSIRSIENAWVKVIAPTLADLGFKFEED